MDELSHQTSADTPGVPRTAACFIMMLRVCVWTLHILMCTVRSPEFTATSHAAAVHLHASLLYLLLQWPPDISPFTLLARRRLHLLRPAFDSLLEDDAFDWLDSPGPPDWVAACTHSLRDVLCAQNNLFSLHISELRKWHLDPCTFIYIKYIRL